MKKRLTPIGNSLGLVIEKPILELLNIDRETELEVRTDNGSRIIIEPTNAHRKRVMDAAKRIAEKHASTFEKLAK